MSSLGEGGVLKQGAQVAWVHIGSNQAASSIVGV